MSRAQPRHILPACAILMLAAAGVRGDAPLFPTGPLLVESISLARKEWQPDACLAKVSYWQDRIASRDSGRGWMIKGLKRDTAVFYFYSPQDWKRTYSVQYTDGEFVHAGVGKSDTGDVCISDIEVSLEDAIVIAGRAGLVSGVMVALALELEPRKGRIVWRVYLKEPGTVRATLTDLSEAPLGSVEIDAASGKILKTRPL